MNRTPRGRLGLLAAVALSGAVLAGATVPAAAETHALVIGIDRYAHGTSLKGAVNDARDLASALKEIGVKDLTVLLDDDANRDAIAAAWKGMLDRTRSGDLIVLTYAGHGSQMPERVKGSETDHLDEVLLLGGFQPKGPGAREHIVDDELNAWLKEAGAKGAEVLFVADNCHSGTLTRSIDARADAPVFRSQPPYMVDDAMLKLDLPEEAATVSEDDLKHVTFLSGGQENEKVPEIAVPGPDGKPAKRGALSVVVARALRGEADANRDRTLTRGELFPFVRENVRMLAEARQTPNLLPAADMDRPAFVGVGTATAAATVAASTAAAQNRGDPLGLPVRVLVTGVGAVEAKAIAAQIKGAVPAESREQADLIWDAARQEVVTAQGDLAATGIGADALQGVADKARMLALGREFGRGGVLEMRLLPGDREHRRGETVAFALNRRPYPYLVVFSIAGDGTIQHHYPLKGEPAALPVERSFELKFEVGPPFGADHLVAIASPEPLDGLRTAVQALNDTRNLPEAARVLRSQLAGKTYALGIQGLFTKP